MEKVKLLLARVIFGILKFFLNIIYFFLPALVVFILLVSQQGIKLRAGVPTQKIKSEQKVHDILPNTTWGVLRPCGEYFNEQVEFAKALSCANTKVWPKRPLPSNLAIPRCFVVPTTSPDVFSDPNKIFNFIAVRTPLGIMAVVGVYDQETRTVFVVENADAPEIFRHETQHLMLHIHDPETEGAGHDQPIWEKCEKPYYTPSLRAKGIGVLRQE